MTDLMTHIVGVKSKEEAIESFFAYHEAHNGRRRLKPRDVIKIVQCRTIDCGAYGKSYDIYYRVPARILKHTTTEKEDESILAEAKSMQVEPESLIDQGIKRIKAASRGGSTRDKVLDDVKANPWSSQKAIGQRLGVTDTHINGILREFIEAGILVREDRIAEGKTKKTYCAKEAK